MTTPPLPNPKIPPPVQPVTASDLRHTFLLVDAALANTAKRKQYSADQVADMLLDIRNMLDRLSSPSTLIYLAKELYDETRSFERRVTGA